MKRLTVLATLSVVLLSFLPSGASTPLEDKASSYASFGGEFDGWHVYAGVRDVRPAAVGQPSRSACLTAWRTNVDTTVTPATRTYLVEEGCTPAPTRYVIDAVHWTASSYGSISTTMTKISYVRDANGVWIEENRSTSTGTSSYNLTWNASFGVGVPGAITVGFPVCWVFFVVPFPCPSTTVGAGLSRPSYASGQIYFAGLKTTFDAWTIYPDESANTLGIWWQT